MSTVAAKMMTAEEFFDWSHLPENRDRHGVVFGNSVWILGSYTRQRRRGYVCSNDTGLVLEREPDTVRGADVALYLESRAYEDLKIKYSESLPTLAVEVLSLTDRWKKMLRRIGQFLARGVAMVWLVDPEDRTVTVFRKGQEPIFLEETDELTGLDVLPDFRCSVADFFVIPQ